MNQPVLTALAARRSITSIRPGFIGAALLGLAACASIPNPTAEMATARASVEDARRAGAGQLAPTEMGQAQDLLTAAERAQAAEQYVTARRAAEQANATADLAEEKARLAKAGQAKAEIDAALDALRGDAARTPR